MTTFLLWASGIVLVSGVAILLWMLRESRVGIHPTCRKCGYDLRGIWKRIHQCPECGGDVRIVARGNWKFEWRMIAGPVLLLLLGLSLGGVALAPRIYRAVAPGSTTGGLLAQTLSFDRKKAATAYTELRSRRADGRFSTAEEAIYQARLKDRAKVDRLARSLPTAARTIGEARTALIIWTQLTRLGVDAPKPAVDEQYVSAEEIEKIIRAIEVEAELEAMAPVPEAPPVFNLAPESEPVTKAPRLPDKKPTGRFDPY